MRRKALESKVEMDTVLSEAFFSFYWLSEQRHISAGPMGSIEMMIPLSEIKVYHETFNPKMDFDHFVRVIRSADREYMTILSERRQQEARKLKRK